MQMNDYINDFTLHLEDALKIGDKAQFKKTSKKITNVLICGLGGSGIGGSIIKDIVSNTVSIPITISKGYEIPAFVNNQTLVIACSYSGNTERLFTLWKKVLKKMLKLQL